MSPAAAATSTAAALQAEARTSDLAKGAAEGELAKAKAEAATERERAAAAAAKLARAEYRVGELEAERDEGRAHLKMMEEHAACRRPLEAEALEVLLGHWTWFSLLTRCALAIWDQAYKFIRVGRGRGPQPLWESVRPCEGERLVNKKDLRCPRVSELRGRQTIENVKV